MLGLREFYRLLPDVDLKECYFEKAWGFRKDEFVLANWREMSVREMKKAVREALPQTAGRPVYPPCKVDVDTLKTKEEIVRAFWELKYVPAEVYMTAVGGAHVLRSVKAGDVGEDPEVVKDYLFWACRAGLDLPVIRGLAEKCGKGYIDMAAELAATGGHTDVLDLLASEFGARIGVDCLTGAARWGHDAMIDHLMEEYGVDPNWADRVGWTALDRAAMRGRVRTVQHLVEKHNVDIHKRSGGGETALDLAEACGYTECAAYLRALQSTRPPPYWSRGPLARPVPPVLSSSLVCNQSQLVPSLSMMEPRGSSGTGCPWALSETKRLEDNEFVIVPSPPHVHVVHHRHARVDEEQGEGGQAGRRERA